MNNRIGIDFDGTILPFGPLVDLEQPPFKKTPEAIQLLKESGFKIIILTSRLSPSWWEEDYKSFGAENAAVFGAAQTKYVKDYLNKWKIPFDLITCEKVPCRIYFDDKYININPDYPLREAIADFLVSK